MAGVDQRYPGVMERLASRPLSRLEQHLDEAVLLFLELLVRLRSLFEWQPVAALRTYPQDVATAAASAKTLDAATRKPAYG